eukprot:617688-Amphidinium_carterae.1
MELTTVWTSSCVSLRQLRVCGDSVQRISRAGDKRTWEKLASWLGAENRRQSWCAQVRLSSLETIAL